MSHTPALYSLPAEEALVVGLLWGDLGTQWVVWDEFTDDDLFYNHLRLVASTARRIVRDGYEDLSLSPGPEGCTSISVAAVLEANGELELVRWRGLAGFELLQDLWARYALDPASWYAPAMANIVHNYAERRRAAQEAQALIKKAYGDTRPPPQQRVEPERGSWIEG